MQRCEVVSSSCVILETSIYVRAYGQPPGKAQLDELFEALSHPRCRILQLVPVLVDVSKLFEVAVEIRCS